jgi:outer membrane autotransporter protein
MLGTMHERIGDTLTHFSLGDNPDARGWGRLFAQHIEHRYAAYTNPTTDGVLLGFQTGQDIFRREGAAGDRDAAGFYLAYSRNDLCLDGLVTNADASGYTRKNVGDLYLTGYSLAGYWTHYGADEWYVNGVLQGTSYNGETQTPNTELALRGNGALASLEIGYPMKLRQGHNFVLEPQIQGIWQRVNFEEQDDGFGKVDLGTTYMTTVRLGLRWLWTLSSEDGKIWQPYARVNYWRDWSGDAVTRFDGDSVPLVIHGERMEYAGGLSVKTSEHLSFYAQGGIQHGIGEADHENQRAFIGNLGLRYEW